MKGIKESISPISKMYTATEECQKINPVFYRSTCNATYCSTCRSVQRWRGEDWRMFWANCVGKNGEAIGV